jgi:hypothetical protein
MGDGCVHKQIYANGDNHICTKCREAVKFQENYRRHPILRAEVDGAYFPVYELSEENLSESYSIMANPGKDAKTLVDALEEYGAVNNDGVLIKIRCTPEQGERLQKDKTEKKKPLDQILIITKHK